MEAHGEELRRHLVGMLDRPDDAEDVLQEVWLTAHASPPDGGEGSNVRAWLYRVATNAALDRLARERRRSSLRDARRADLAPGPVPPPDDDEWGEAIREAVRRRVAALPRKQREAVWLRWIDGEEYEDVADAMGTTVPAARANVYQGLRRLRAESTDLWKGEVTP
jgi:RNA polymerase sigma-70 factor (ECF subfamily)